jgi:hypothetical protein
MTAAVDFGVPVEALRSTDEIFGLPPEVAQRRTERGELTVVPDLEPEQPEEIPGQARAAVEAEANGTGTRFEFDGETYTVESMDEWDIDVFDAEASGRPWQVVRILLGDAQYERFKSEPDPERPSRRRKKKRTLSDLNDMLTAINRAVGVEPGESVA